MGKVKLSRDRHIQQRTPTKVDGAISAAMLSSGIGCLVIGLLTTGAVISEWLKNALNWWNPAGPLSGKTSVGVIVWLIAWAVFHSVWKGQETELKKTFTISLILIAIGFALTFPPVFEAFE
ncbi:MAG: hypothetical protein VR64_11885 [Desulfatitalea sp. BRH_c12]|nr:MAG: hypothetical protein VR64_11885 [Desulfatitalea sp. BRH_c12]